MGHPNGAIKAQDLLYCFYYFMIVLFIGFIVVVNHPELLTMCININLLNKEIKARIEEEKIIDCILRDGDKLLKLFMLVIKEKVTLFIFPLLFSYSSLYFFLFLLCSFSSFFFFLFSKFALVFIIENWNL